MYRFGHAVYIGLCFVFRLGLDPIDRVRESSPVYRLQQVVDRMQLKGIDRLLIKSGAKDNHWTRTGQARRNLEPAGSRHLNIQQYQIWLQRRDALDGLFSVACLSDDLPNTFLGPRATSIVENSATFAPRPNRPVAQVQQPSHILTHK